MVDLRVDEAKLREYQRSLAGESDRGCVLVTIATLDELFRSVALDKLSHGTKETLKRLLDPPLGYLSGFMAKVDLLFSLGAVTKGEYDDVVSINRLRNSCAHSLTPFTFTESVYDKWLKQTTGARLVARIADEGFHYLPAHVQNQASPRPWRLMCESTLVMNLTLLNVALSHLHAQSTGSIEITPAPSTEPGRGAS